MLVTTTTYRFDTDGVMCACDAVMRPPRCADNAVVSFCYLVVSSSAFTASLQNVGEFVLCVLMSSGSCGGNLNLELTSSSATTFILSCSVP